MRRVVSVWGLLARETVWKLAFAVAVMGILETVLFVMAAGGEYETAFQESRFRYGFTLAFLAFYLILLDGGMERGAKSGYTWQRLRLAESRVFLVHSFHNLLCFLLLWAAQGVLIFALTIWYGHVHPERMGPQTVFLAFLRNAFLHNLLPLPEWSRWARNAVLLLCAAIGAARGALRQRYTGKLPLFTCAFVVMCLHFESSLGSVEVDGVILLVSAAVTIGLTISALSYAHGGAGRDTDPTEEGAYRPSWEEGVHEKT